MQVTILIPVYNEADQLPLTLEVLRDNLEALVPPVDYRLLLVDDGSRDSSWEIISEASASDERISGLRLSRNFGKEAALCAGLDAATGDAVLLMDGDLQHPPRYIQDFLRLHREGWDIVEGVKTSRGREGRLHHFLVGSFYHIFAKTTGIDLENASDFKLLDRRVVDAWKELQERNTFFRGLSHWLGFRRTTLPFTVDERPQGRSKWKLSSLFRLAVTALTSFSSKPLLLIAWLGGLFLLLAIVLGIHTLVNFLSGHALGGFTTVILLQLLIGGCVMTSLGLIGLYLGRIYEEVKARPRYLLAERTGKSEEKA